MKYVVFIIVLIILLNIGFSYKYFSSVFYDDSFDGVTSEISKLFSDKKYEWGVEDKEIGDLLKKQPGIENEYVMSDMVTYAYYSGSKFLYTDFHAGEPSDSINDFIERKNWSEYELYISNIHSYPRDKYDLLKPVPDYVVYRGVLYDDNNPHYQKPPNHADVSILSNPDNEELPSNFELLYKSNKTQIVVYKIHNIEN